MTAKIVKLTEDKYKDWDRFCEQNDDAWFLHTTDSIQYALNYKPELKSKDLSFLVYRQDEIAAVVPLAIESYANGKKEFSFGAGENIFPALKNGFKQDVREDIFQLIFSEIDRLADQEKVVRAKFRFSTLSPSFLKNTMPVNYLFMLGYLDTSLNTLMIDLNKTEEQLWDDLRRNHRRNILKGENFKVKIYTAKNITKEIFDAYKKMHRKAAGRQTRPDITFDLMYGWLTRNLAFLAVVEFEDKMIGFEYYSVYKNNVEGFSAANDPDYEKDHPIRHLLEWEAIKWMKNQRFNFYEIGLQWYGNLLHDYPDQKQLNISHFKKGFGGFTMPLMAGEKYYDKNYFLEIYQQRINKFALGLEKNEK